MINRGLMPDPHEPGNSALHEAIRGCMQSDHCLTACILTDCYLAAVAATTVFLAFWATPIGLFGSLRIKRTLV